MYCSLISGKHELTAIMCGMLYTFDTEVHYIRVTDTICGDITAVITMLTPLSPCEHMQ